MKTKRLVALVALALAAAGALAAEVPAHFAGGVLVDARGMTLYTFDNDVAGSGKSLCNGACAALWPPALAAAGTARPGEPFGLAARDDGALQWTYQGRPVYAYVSDQKPGDRTGDGFRGVWHVIKP